MKLTNNYNLPDTFSQAIKNDKYKREGDISASELINPPQIRQLMKRYGDQISEDISDRIWSLLGQSVHSILERSDATNSLMEERLSAEVMGWKISGQFDLYSNEILYDYKVVGVMGYKSGLKDTWEKQLNIYRWLLEKHGFSVKKAQIVMILRDWLRLRAKTDADYPQAAVATVDVPLWDLDETRKYIEDRVNLHQLAESLPDEKLPGCSSEERWERPTTYAVKKSAEAVRAYRVFEEPLAAATLASEKGMVVETRPGSNIRCEEFCPVREFCHQRQIALGIKTAA